MWNKIAEFWKDAMKHRWVQATVNVGVAEVLSAITVLLGLRWLNKNPHHLDALEEKVGKKIIEPRLEKFEKLAAGSGYIEQEEYDNRHKKTHAERVQKIAKPMTELLATGAVGWGVGFGFQEATNRVMKTDFGKSIVFGRAVDPVVQIGTIILLATTWQKSRKWMAGSISDMLQNTTGMKKEEADRFGNYVAVWKTSDLAGAVSKIAILTAMGAAASKAIRH